MCDEEEEDEEEYEEEDAAQECRTVLFVDGFSWFRVKAVRIRYGREYTLRKLVKYRYFLQYAPKFVLDWICMLIISILIDFKQKMETQIFEKFRKFL